MTAPDDGSSPALKKQKVSASDSQATSVVLQEGAEDANGWTRVEKRSMKKQKKIAAKQEVSRTLNAGYVEANAAIAVELSTFPVCTGRNFEEETCSRYRCTYNTVDFCSP